MRLKQQQKDKSSWRDTETRSDKREGSVQIETQNEAMKKERKKRERERIGAAYSPCFGFVFADTKKKTQF